MIAGFACAANEIDCLPNWTRFGDRTGSSSFRKIGQASAACRSALCRSRKRARRRAIDHHSSAAFAYRPRRTMTAPMSASPLSTSSKSRTSDHGSAHKIARGSSTLLSVGFSAEAASATANAEYAPGSHQEWRYQSGRRGEGMEEIVSCIARRDPSNFARTTRLVVVVASSPQRARSAVLFPDDLDPGRCKCALLGGWAWQHRQPQCRQQPEPPQDGGRSPCNAHE